MRREPLVLACYGFVCIKNVSFWCKDLLTTSHPAFFTPHRHLHRRKLSFPGGCARQLPGHLWLHCGGLHTFLVPKRSSPRGTGLTCGSDAAMRAVGAAPRLRGPVDLDMFDHVISSRPFAPRSTGRW